VVAVVGVELFLPGTLQAIVDADGGPQNPTALMSLLLSFIGVLLGLWIVKVATLSDWKPIMWAKAGRVTRGILAFGGLYAVVVGVLDLISILYGSLLPNIPFSTWILWMPLVVVLVFIQVSAEELLFRGYIQRVLFDWSSSRLIWMVLPSVAFGALHYQPAIMGPNAWLLVVATTVFGLLAAELTYLTRSIGPAIGIHLVNNLNAFLIIQLDSGIGGFALFKTPFTPEDVETLRVSLLQGIGLYAIILVGLLIFGRRIFRR
ncbi:MAG: type II CAAX endopeptidase family protein, partial [Pseudomonadota bacterium]